jgi:hypothetical protein
MIAGCLLMQGDQLPAFHLRQSDHIITASRRIAKTNIFSFLQINNMA